MSKRTKEKQWFENQEEVPGIVTQLKKHYYNYEGLAGLFKPYPYEVNYDQLLEISGGNQELVDAVRNYINQAYFDEAGNPKAYGGFERISITLARKREMSIPDKNATDRIHVAFDQGHAVHFFGGPIGDNYVFEFGMNKSFLYSMSKMM